MDININVTGLDGLAASLNNLAQAIGASNSLATGVEAAAAVAKVQSESKKSTAKKTVQPESVQEIQPAPPTDSVLSRETPATASPSEEPADPKINGQEASAVSADLPSNGSTTTEKDAPSVVPKDAPAPMTIDELRVAAAEASKRNLPATQQLMAQFGGKVSAVPEDKRAELAALLAGV